MKGWVGFLMRYTDIIPICSKDKDYMKKQFNKMICKMLHKKRGILIYPEQEMWFNYRKPRNKNDCKFKEQIKNNC